MKKVSYIIIVLGVLSFVGVFLIRQKMEEARTQIDLISNDLNGLSPDSPMYESLNQERWPYLDQIETFDLYSKILLGSGALFVVLGGVLFFVGSKKVKE